MRSDRKGYTLVELMMAVSIVSILFAVGPKLLTQFNRFFLMSSVRVDLQRDARGILEVINRNLRQAQSNTVVIDRLSSAQPFFSRIRFVKQQGNALEFYQSGGSLVMVENGRTKIMSRDLNYLSFAFPRSDDLSVVSVSMTLQKSTYQAQRKTLHMASERVRVMN